MCCCTPLVEAWSGGTGSGSGSPPCWTLAIGLPAPASATSSPAGAPQPHRSSDPNAERTSRAGRLPGLTHGLDPGGTSPGGLPSPLSRGGSDPPSAGIGSETTDTVSNPAARSLHAHTAASPWPSGWPIGSTTRRPPVSLAPASIPLEEQEVVVVRSCPTDQTADLLSPHRLPPSHAYRTVAQPASARSSSTIVARPSTTITAATIYPRNGWGIGRPPRRAWSTLCQRPRA